MGCFICQQAGLDFASRAAALAAYPITIRRPSPRGIRWPHQCCAWPVGSRRMMTVLFNDGCRQHSDNLASKLDAIVAATSPAPSPIGPIAPNFALSVGVPPVATSQCASPSPADPTSTTGTQSPPCAPPPALISLPPDVVPFELFASVIRQRDVAHSLLRSSLARMRRRRSMSPAHLKAPALQPSECRRRSKSPLSRASPQSEHEGIVAAVDASCRRRAPTRTPPRRTSVTSICTGDEAPTPRRSQRLASRAERRRSVD